ncbi:hypothetical protein GCK72_002616 [Caenorhabditis remanei]|uniref:Uncharacterized protein n=1 Tax=Caenorhabditis remanei TaxID=31234 RepID=A0A6A5HWN8_CAERE|nr:hypothetical protein GCK72_002616 [Caenorhabditis remanei]KAF1770793.1 hypothetical protein GCK72_002616 [Caenorhabditis remanei]
MADFFSMDVQERTFDNSQNGRFALSQLILRCIYFSLPEPKKDLSNFIDIYLRNKEKLAPAVYELFRNYKQQVPRFDRDDHCEKVVNNGYWEVCQSLVDMYRCDKYSYKSSVSDFFSSPYFSGSAGVVIGLISILSAFFLLHFLQRRSGQGSMPTGSRSKVSSSSTGITAPLIPTPKKSKSSETPKKSNTPKSTPKVTPNNTPNKMKTELY